jgi:hypothetical protein
MAESAGNVILTSGDSWTVPSDWNNNANEIDVIGGGGGGGNGTSQTSGGGGAFSAVYNVALTPGSAVSYQVGSGGSGGALTANDSLGNYGYSGGADGGDTWFGGTSYSNSLVAAQGGRGGPADGGSDTPGGQASAGIGTVRFSGGAGSYTIPPGYRPTEQAAEPVVSMGTEATAARTPSAALRTSSSHPGVPAAALAAAGLSEAPLAQPRKRTERQAAPARKG